MRNKITEFKLDRYGCVVSNDTSYLKLYEKFKNEYDTNKTVIDSKSGGNYALPAGHTLFFITKNHKFTYYVFYEELNVCYAINSLGTIEADSVNIKDVFDIIRKANENFETKDAVEYISHVAEVYTAIVREIDLKDIIESKQEAKREAKSYVRYKYKIGEYYGIYKPNSREITTVYQVKKFIYTIGNTFVNIVVMKYINGASTKNVPLTKRDCKMFHLKFEPELYVFPMSTRFTRMNETDVDKFSENYVSAEIQKSIVDNMLSKLKENAAKLMKKSKTDSDDIQQPVKMKPLSEEPKLANKLSDNQRLSDKIMKYWGTGLVCLPE